MIFFYSYIFLYIPIFQVFSHLTELDYVKNIVFLWIFHFMGLIRVVTDESFFLYTSCTVFLNINSNLFIWCLTLYKIMLILFAVSFQRCYVEVLMWRYEVPKPNKSIISYDDVKFLWAVFYINLYFFSSLLSSKTVTHSQFKRWST